MESSGDRNLRDISRRGFLQVAGVAATGASLNVGAESFRAYGRGRQKPPGVVRGAFLYPPSGTLEEAGYYSWPGASFDAEGHHREYAGRIGEMARGFGMTIAMEEPALDGEAGVTRFIDGVKSSRPDGVLLIPFKKGHWPHVKRIVEETRTPTVVLATLGVLLSDHIQEMHRKPGVHLINSLDNFDALAAAMNMIRAASWMKQSLLLNIDGSETKESVVPTLGTRVRTIPHERFYSEFRATEPTEPVKDLARRYLKHAKSVVEPSKDDVLEAAKCYFALKRLIEAEQADALMMNCLPGLQRPHKHVPPCMGFMSLRDEGMPAGCQSDLNATLTLLLVQYLFDRPGFQQNAGMETERNHYFGAHCTSPSRMNGPNGPAEPYVLRSHAEAGWGCVPRVLFTPGQDVTMALYQSGEAPKMLVYSGAIVECPKMPPAGGCRTNIEMTIREVEDVCDVKGMHQIIFYGNHAKSLRTFCQLYGVEVVT